MIINPIVDMGSGSNGEADFAPAIHCAELGEDRFVGLEICCVGFSLPTWSLGAGYGFTPGSDRFTFKAILGYAFPVPNNGGQDNSSPSSLKMGTPSRPLQNTWNFNSVN